MDTDPSVMACPKTFSSSSSILINREFPSHGWYKWYSYSREEEERGKSNTVSRLDLGWPEMKGKGGGRGEGMRGWSSVYPVTSEGEKE